MQITSAGNTEQNGRSEDLLRNLVHDFLRPSCARIREDVLKGRADFNTLFKFRFGFRSALL